MKINFKNIIIEKDKFVVGNEEYDYNGNLIETPAEKYEKPLFPGTIIDYDSEYILILENNGYIDLGHLGAMSYLDYDWANDPRTKNIHSPFKSEREMQEWIKHNEHHKNVLEKYYKKFFFKNYYNC